MAELNWKSSTLVCGHPVAALCEHMDFHSQQIMRVLWRKGKAEIQKRSKEVHGKSMETILATMPARKSRTIQHRMDAVVWLSILPSTDSGTELLAHESCDALSSMRYGEAPPPDLPAHCDGCDAPFTLQHALAC